MNIKVVCALLAVMLVVAMLVDDSEGVRVGRNRWRQRKRYRGRRPRRLAYPVENSASEFKRALESLMLQADELIDSLDSETNADQNQIARDLSDVMEDPDVNED